MIILGLDCATKTGWCLWQGSAKTGRVLESGVQDFAKKRGESNGMMFLRFRAWLNCFSSYQPKDLVVAYEQAHHRGGASTEIGVNLTGRVQEFAAEHGYEFTTVRATTVKKFATGKGNAGKPEMMKAATPFLGRPPVDDNEADGVHIARWAAEEING